MNHLACQQVECNKLKGDHWWTYIAQFDGELNNMDDAENYIFTSDALNCPNCE
jgi:hypothetical protein